MKSGDIQLENCDCLSFMKGMKNESVDLIIADPPYEWHNMYEYFEEMLRILKYSGSMYIFGDKDIVAQFWYSQLNAKYKTLLIWYYKNSPKPRGRWRQSMQSIIYSYRSLEYSIFNEDEARVEYMSATKALNGRMRPSSGRMLVSKPYDTSKGALPRDVIEYPASTGHLSKELVGHPFQKPIGLIEKLIKTSSKVGDLVFDPFTGSGTTLVAARKLNRKCIGCEIDKQWIPVVWQRIADSIEI